MFYQECEDLANNHYDLKDVIKKIDAKLHSDRSSGILKPDIIASLINENPDEVSGIFQQLHEKGLLNQKKYIECPDPQCKNLMKTEDYDKAIENEDSFECTQCQKDLIENPPNIVEKYRLNPPKIQNKEQENDKQKDDISINEPKFNQEIPERVLKNPFEYTPLLKYYSREPNWLESQPFGNKRVFFVLHFLKDLIPFVKACENLGLNLKNSYFFYKEYPYPQKEAIKNWLEKQGATVKPRSEIENTLKQLSESTSERVGKILIVEDGGFFVPIIHEEFPNLLPCVIGAVEQTRRGIFNAEEVEELKIPVISVATCEIKNTFEPNFVAEAVIDNIKQMLPNISLRRKTATIFGYGTIGKKIDENLRKNGVIPTIFDPYPPRRLEVEGVELAESPGQAVHDKNFVIGTSGRRSIDSNVISHISHGTYLISASSELYEIDVDELRRQSNKEDPLENVNGEIIGTTFILPPNDRQIYVLANGYPINFWGFESMPEEASDLILSIILLSAAELASGNYSEPIINSEGSKTFINPNAVNQIAEKHEIAKKFLEFHKQG